MDGWEGAGIHDNVLKLTTHADVKFSVFLEYWGESGPSKIANSLICSIPQTLTGLPSPKQISRNRDIPYPTGTTLLGGPSAPRPPITSTLT